MLLNTVGKILGVFMSVRFLCFLFRLSFPQNIGNLTEDMY
ncbi:MAG: hypothetical protein RHS_5055 [Robinsoniella sp. RHS]|nr:MAG: hypothetical protein RHS_5055 [Robinsoniella sp. RHS]